MKRTIITIGVIGVLLITGGYYFLVRNTSALSPKTETERQPPDGWYEYRNGRYIFSLFYPEGIAVEEFDEGKGAKTFVFENKEDGLGFQIFVVPYGEEKISDSRFLLDVPSGIRENPSSFYIDGVVATSFYSKNIALGDTWEVWFVYKGFLYEVTTIREQEFWLSEIMKTWLFI